MLQTAAPIPEAQIRSAVEQAFRSTGIRHMSLKDRFWMWLADQWAAFWEWFFGLVRAARAADPVAIMLLALAALIVMVLLWQLVGSWRGRGRAGAPGRPWTAGEVQRGDPWAAAQRLASAGDYTAAAHALYGALLDAAARGQQVRIHPSKTVGDYARELRSRRSRLFADFRKFAGDYEVVIYDDQHCDRERYERLFQLAVPMLSADG
jgi:hypothetical protein